MSSADNNRSVLIYLSSCLTLMLLSRVKHR